MVEYKNITNKNTIIKTKVFLPETNKKYDRMFILCHGFASSKESDSISIISKKLNEKNIPAIAFDFPGHGESVDNIEKLTVENCISYINIIENYIKEILKINKISIFATSFGGYVTINKLIKENINDFENIILRSPAIDMKNILLSSLIKDDICTFQTNKKAKAGFGGKIEIPYSFYENLCENDILKSYNMSDKIIIFHGTKDDTSPILDTYKFIRQNPKNKMLIELEGLQHKISNKEIEVIANKMLSELGLT